MEPVNYDGKSKVGAVSNIERSGGDVSRQRIKDILGQAVDGKQVEVRGWVKSKRVSKNFAFVVINDGSTQHDLQVIVDSGTAAFDVLGDCTVGSSVKILGTIKDSPGKGQQWEVQGTAIEVIGTADPDRYPLQKKGHSLEFLREIAHIRGRTNTFGAVFRVRNQLSQLVHRYFQDRGFVWAHTPLITAGDCEGAGEQFQVTTMEPDQWKKDDLGNWNFKDDFFGEQAHLAVSGQLNGEALALSVGDIYTFGPTFRAENSNTARHLSEFWMVEPEMAFADLKDDMDLAEGFIRAMFSGIVESCPEEIEFLGKTYKETSAESLMKLAQEPFQRISYTDAVDQLLKVKKFQYPVKWGNDLQTEHERFLAEEVFKRPVIVYDYPKDIKAFYMKLNDDEKTVAAMDVLVPRVGEIIGGSQREDQVDLLSARMDEVGVPQAGMEWYLDLRRYGGTPHAGFGLGFERLVQYVTGMANIRDVIPFPRVPNGITF